jgi:hypothetical protein
MGERSELLMWLLLLVMLLRVCAMRSEDSRIESAPPSEP